MRKIRFRFIDKRSSKILHGAEHLYSVAGNGDILYIDGSEVSSYIDVEQGTGFFDKNGKEIYEGDIVKNSLRRYIVRYGVYWGPDVDDLEGYGFYKEDIKDIKNVEGLYELENVADFWKLKIIGNSTENPDLLKE